MARGFAGPEAREQEEPRHAGEARDGHEHPGPEEGSEYGQGQSEVGRLFHPRARGDPEDGVPHDQRADCGGHPVAEARIPGRMGYGGDDAQEEGAGRRHSHQARCRRADPQGEPHGGQPIPPRQEPGGRLQQRYGPGVGPLAEPLHQPVPDAGLSVWSSWPHVSLPESE